MYRSELASHDSLCGHVEEEGNDAGPPLEQLALLALTADGGSPVLLVLRDRHEVWRHDHRQVRNVHLVILLAEYQKLNPSPYSAVQSEP